MSYGTLMSQTPSTLFSLATLHITGPTAGSTVTVTSTGGGTQTAKEISSGVWEIEVDKGNWVVSCTGALDETVEVNTNKLYEIVLTSPDAVLENNSWAMIKAVAQSGKAPQIWSIGDRKKVSLNGSGNTITLNNYPVEAFIIDFEHMVSASVYSNKRIDFQIGIANVNQIVGFVDDDYGKVPDDPMNRLTMAQHAPRYGSWLDGGVFNMLNNKTDVFPSFLPKELLDVLEKYTVYFTSTRNNNIEFIITSTTLSILSEYEMFGTNRIGIDESAYEKQKPYFKSGNDKTIWQYNDTRFNAKSWLRTHAKDKVNYVATVGSITNEYIEYGNYSYGICPVFSI